MVQYHLKSLAELLQVPNLIISKSLPYLSLVLMLALLLQTIFFTLLASLVFFFFFLKAIHGVSGTKNLRFYGHLARRQALFTVCSGSYIRCQNLFCPSVCASPLPFYLFNPQILFQKHLSFTVLLAVTPSYYTGALLMWLQRQGCVSPLQSSD